MWILQGCLWRKGMMIIIKGKNGNTITIPTADDNDRTISIPFDIAKSDVIDLGLNNINTNNLAVGYSIGLSARASATVGSTGSANITAVNFLTNSQSKSGTNQTEIIGTN